MVTVTDRVERQNATLSTDPGDDAAGVERVLAAAKRADATSYDIDVDALHEILRQSALRPSRALADALHGLLENEHLGALTSRGRLTRTMLSETLVALGYPYALEVPPDEWAARRRAGPRGRPAAIMLGIVGFLSMGWHSLFVLFFAATGGWDAFEVTLPFMLGLVHAVVAFVAAFNPAKSRSVLVGLAWGGLLGPAVALLYGLPFFSFGIGATVLAFATPGMATAAMALVTARAVREPPAART